MRPIPRIDATGDNREMLSMPDPANMTGWSSSQLREWVASLDEPRALRGVNWWLGARWTPQLHAYDNTLAGEARREWAEVFLLLVDGMDRFTTYDPWRAALDRFMMRAYVVSRLGQVEGSATWNADSLAHDILGMLSISPEQAREESQSWRSLAIDQIKTLRNHKNMLKPLKCVVDLLEPSPSADRAREWLALRPALP
jgi:hypothetical protein